MICSPVPDLPRCDFRLRNIERRDAAAWFDYLRLREVYEHTSWNVATADDLAPNFALYESSAPDSPLRLAVVRADEKAMIGTVGLHSISTVNRSAELAYDFSPAVWRRGLATDCAQAMIAWAFAAGFVRVQATALPSNLPSIRVLERCGMTPEGLLRKYRMVRGEPRDFLIYAVTR